jgi:hypothetical protein
MLVEKETSANTSRFVVKLDITGLSYSLIPSSTLGGSIRKFTHRFNCYLMIAICG